MKLPHRRNFLHLAAGAASMPAMSQVAWAQAYPSRPVRIIVAAAAGGSNDILARLVGQSLSERLGQPFVVENRPGGGWQYRHQVSRACASRRLYASCGPDWGNTINTTLYDKLNFNLTSDIVPVAGIFRGSYVVVVNPSVPAKTIPEFITYAKSYPGQDQHGSVGRHRNRAPRGWRAARRS